MRDYNFFELYQQRKGLQIDFKSPIFLGILVFLLIIVVTAGFMVRNLILTVQLANLSEDLQAVQSSKAYQEASQMQTAISAMAEYDQYASAALERVEMGDVLGTGFLKSLSETIPATVTLQGAAINRATASFYFIVPDRKTAAELLNRLEQSGLFLQTTLTSVALNQGETGGMIATIDSILKAGEEN